MRTYFDKLFCFMLSLFVFEPFDMPIVLCFDVLLLATLPLDVPCGTVRRNARTWRLAA